MKKLDESGATALEFAFVGLIFFAFVYAIVGLGIQFFNTTSLDFAVYEAARSLQTGAVELNGNAQTAQQFTSNYLSKTLYDLDYNQVVGHVNLTTVNASNTNCGQATPNTACFTNLITKTPVLNPDGTVAYYVTALKQLSNSYCVPSPGTIVYIQVTYPESNVPSLNLGFGSFIRGIQSGATVMVEPFPDSSEGTC